MPPSTERADPGRQWAELLQLLVHTRAVNRFYQRKWAELPAGATPGSPADFAERWPLTLKSELVDDQAAHPPYGTALCVPWERCVRLHQTSGTSGSPLRWLDTAESWASMVADWGEVWRAAGLREGERIFFAFSFGPFIGFWLAFESAQRLGCLCIPGGGMSSTLRLRAILENQATVLCCTPTYALHLAETARNEGIPLERSAVRLILVAGEPGGSDPGLRRRLSAAWNGARVFDHHGMTEVGPVTHEDPEAPGRLIVMERSFFAESIDPATGRPAAEGAPGELVLTTLRRSSSPLIRYRTGDWVRLVRSSPAAPAALDGGILGRVDDMVVVRGVNLYPAAVDRWVRSLSEIGEYRVTLDQRTPMTEVSVEIEAGPDAVAALERLLREQLGLRISVVAAARGSLPRFELKARRWRRLAPERPSGSL